MRVSTMLYVALLKACGRRKDLHEGTRLHAEILDRGLLEKNPHLGSTLISMYSKCGELAKASEVFEELPVQSIASWNAVIAAHTHHHQDRFGEALNYFERMQSEGFDPNAVTFTCILKVYGNLQDISKGRQIHDELVSRGLLGKDVMLGTALVDMYAKCWELPRAEEAFGELPMRNAVSWSVLIAGHAQMERFENAIELFERMGIEGLSPDAIVLTAATNACGSALALDKGKEAHVAILSRRLLEEDALLGNALVDMYAKCGELEQAARVLAELPRRDTVTWSALLAGYAEQGRFHEAWECSKRMRIEGLSPDAIAYVSVLKACRRGVANAVGEGMRIHAEVRSADLPGKHVAVLGNALVDMYARCGSLARAHRVLEELPARDVAAWNAMIAGCVRRGRYRSALDCLEQLESEGLSADAVTFLCVLDACGSTGDSERGRSIHRDALTKGCFERVGKALVDFYARCGELGTAQLVADELRVRDVGTWNALIAGYASRGRAGDAFGCFRHMRIEGIDPDPVSFVCVLQCCAFAGARDEGRRLHRDVLRRGLLGKDIRIGNALVHMYCRWRMPRAALRVLEELPLRDAVSWNTVMASAAQEGRAGDALACLDSMRSEGISPDAATRKIGETTAAGFRGPADAAALPAVLRACGDAGALEKGREIHRGIVASGSLDDDLALANALLDMYARCGAMATARNVLQSLRARDVVSWSCVVAGYARQGRALQALSSLESMRSEGLPPNEITLLGALRACSRSGLSEAAALWETAMNSYEILPSLEHQASLVAVLGRMGDFDKAMSTVGVASSNPRRSPDLWLALLGACQRSGHAKLGSLAFDHLLQLDRTSFAIARTREDAGNLQIRCSLPS